jgi:hypothetical protein
MFDFEKEFDIHEDHVVIPPSSTPSPYWDEEDEERFLFTSWVVEHWQIGMRVTATMPFFFLFIVSFTAVVFWPAAAYLMITWAGASIGYHVLK